MRLRLEPGESIVLRTLRDTRVKGPVRIDRRLTDLERRAGAQKATREARKEQEARRQAKDADAARGLGVGMTAAYAILGMPLLGAGLGWLVDQRLGTNVWLGLGMLAGATAGVGFALFVLQRSGRGS